MQLTPLLKPFFKKAWQSKLLPNISGENASFNDEGDNTAGWTTSNCAVAVVGSYLRQTKTSAGTSSSISKAVTFTPDNRDYILYGNVRASALSASDISALWFINGSKEFSIWLGSASATSTGDIGSASIAGTTGTSTKNTAVVASAGTLDYANNAIEFALQYDSKFGQMVCWLKEQDGRWKFSARVACDWFAPSPLQIQILKTSNAPANSWVEFDYLTLCKPNFVAIGDSICAGATLFNPNRTVGLTNDDSTWMRHCAPYQNLRNNLIVNKGVGSQSSMQINARIVEATREGAQVIFLHASSNDEALGVSLATRTANIQASINSISAAGAFPVLLNAVYGTATEPTNLPTPDLRDYMRGWWDVNMTQMSGTFTPINIMNPIIDSNGFMSDSLTQSDKIHPTVSGYKLIGEYISNY